MEKDEPLSVLLIDIDHFKSFNDKFGHGVGDQVLRLVAKALRDRVRDIDLPARYGGEELIAVLPGADLAACQAVAERIRQLDRASAPSPAAPPAKCCPASRSRSASASSSRASRWRI